VGRGGKRRGRKGRDKGRDDRVQEGGLAPMLLEGIDAPDR